MRQFAALLFLAALGLTAGCGSSSSPAVPASLTISPSAASIGFGDTLQLSAIVDDAGGTVVSNATVTYATSDSSAADVSTGGLICGGTWDSESTPVVCTPPKSTVTRTATITATAQVAKVSGTATGTATVSVHIHVDSVTITPPSSSACISQANAATYTAVACSGNEPGTGGCARGHSLGDVGAPSWSVLPATVASANTTNSCTSFVGSSYPCLITAGSPGQGSVTATVTNTVSSSAPFTTCPIVGITLKDTNNNTSASLSSSGTSTLNAVVVDSNGVTLTDLPALVFNNSAPMVASETAGTTDNYTVTGTAAGTTTLTASCTPPSCNTGLFSVYSNIYGVSVSGTTSTTVYVASSDSTSLIPITTSNNTVGTAVTLPAAPNSMVVSPNGSEILLGTGSNTGSTGVMVFSVSESTVSTLNFYGRVLAVSPDGNLIAVFYGPAEGNSQTAAVYIYDTSSSTTAAIPLTSYSPGPFGPRAAFSPDSTQGLVIAGNQMVVWSPSTAPHVFPLAAATDVDFLAEGSFAYVTGGSDVSAYASCSLLGSVLATPDSLAATSPTLIRAVPNSTTMVAADPPNVDLITASNAGSPWGGNTIFAPPSGCLAPWLATPTAVHPNSLSSFSLNAGDYTPSQLIATADGSKAIVLANRNSVLLYNISGNSASAIPLSGGAATTTGGATLDSAYLYVGGKDGNVHRINFSTASDDTQISPGITPEFVVVVP